MPLDRWNNIGGWHNGIYYTFRDDIIWSTGYTIKLNKWKAKQRIKLNIKKVSESSGSISLCRHCNGAGWKNNNNFNLFCYSCFGSGLQDWVSGILAKEIIVI